MIGRAGIKDGGDVHTVLGILKTPSRVYFVVWELHLHKAAIRKPMQNECGP